MFCKEGTMIRHKGGASFFLLIVSLALVACGSSKKTGNISGRLVFGSYDEKNAQEGPGDPHSRRLGIANALIVLGQVERRLPEGPAVADRNENKNEVIARIRANLKAVTDSNGRFMLDKVPVGTYLVLFHLFPGNVSKEQRDDWDGLPVPKADVDGSFARVPSSLIAFWLRGGLVSGNGNWNSQDGFTLTQGNVFSDWYGFGYCVRDERPYPIVKVQPDSTVEALLTSRILGKGAKLGIEPTVEIRK
jgi:hypothetical protein